MPRIFTGLRIPPDIAARLALLQGGIEHARWIDGRDYHITLRFIGDVDQALAGEVARALGRISWSAFSLRLSGLGWFGGKRPHSVHALVEPNPALDRLQAAHEQACRAAGLAPETRKFIAHVTLARLRGARLAQVRDFVSAHGLFSAGPFAVEEFALFSARPSRGGGPYAIEQTWPATGARVRNRA